MERITLPQVLNTVTTTIITVTMEDKTIQVKENTYNTLKFLGKKGETFDDIIQNLLKEKRKRPVIIQ